MKIFTYVQILNLMIYSHILRAQVLENKDNNRLSVIKCEDFSEGLAVIVVEGTDKRKYYGYINEKGEIAISPSYELAFSFHNGFGLVKSFKKDEGYFFINNSNNNQFQLNFEEALDFNEGLAAVRQKGEWWRFINLEGKFITEPIYNWVDIFHDSIARVSKNGKVGYINSKGIEIFIPQFSCGSNFSEGLALVGQDINASITQYSFIDKFGKLAFKVNKETQQINLNCCSQSEIKPAWDKKCSFKDGRIVMTLAPPMVSYVEQVIFSRDGNKVKLSQEDVHPFSEGLAVARKHVGKKYGYINSKGSWIIDPIFDLANDFREGLAAVKMNENWGFINTKGEVVINKDILKPKTAILTSPKFDEAYDFQDGLAIVKVDGNYGFIDTNGNWKIKPKFFRALPFMGKFSRVISDKYGWNYINRDGELLLK